MRESKRIKVVYSRWYLRSIISVRKYHKMRNERIRRLVSVRKVVDESSKLEDDEIDHHITSQE